MTELCILLLGGGRFYQQSSGIARHSRVARARFVCRSRCGSSAISAVLLQTHPACSSGAEQQHTSIGAVPLQAKELENRLANHLCLWWGLKRLCRVCWALCAAVQGGPGSLSPLCVTQSLSDSAGAASIAGAAVCPGCSISGWAPFCTATALCLSRSEEQLMKGGN